MKNLILGFLLLATSLHAETKKALIVKLEGTVELGLSPYIQRALKEAKEDGFTTVILDIDTFGGRIDAAVDIRDALLDSSLETVAFVNKRAISAGALISLACKKIYFTPGSTMGAATPIELGAEGAEDVGKKVVSYFRAEMGSTAERFNRDKKIAESMVQATENIPGLVKKGEVLTLTDQSALKTKISLGTLDSRASLLKELAIEESNTKEFQINWAEKTVRFLTDPTVSNLLMSGAVLTLIFELKAPGLGLAGLLSAILFGAFFFGKYLVNLSGMEEILFFILGLGLILAELVFFPGTVVLGILGVLSFLGALFFAGVSSKTPFDLSFPTIQIHLAGIAWAFLIATIGIVAFFWTLRSRWQKLPLVQNSVLENSKNELEVFVGQEGLTQTAMRPSGRIHINDKILDAVTRGEFLEPQTKVKVVDLQNNTLLVEKKS